MFYLDHSKVLLFILGLFDPDLYYFCKNVSQGQTLLKSFSNSFFYLDLANCFLFDPDVSNSFLILFDPDLDSAKVFFIL